MSPTSSGDSSRRRAPDAESVLDYWFGDRDDPENVKRRGKLWFASTPKQDRDIRERFGPLHERAQNGELDDWAGRSDTALALVILLDQFTRNLYRGTASAFANDERALAITRDAVERELDRSLHAVERAFLYMPFQHSENAADQDRSILLYKALIKASPEPFQSFATDTYKYAVLHHDIVKRFGRFPHRNELLGRASTPEELRYLNEGGQRFGQG